MKVGDEVFYTDLSQEKISYIIKAFITDIQESSGLKGSRGHQTFLGLKVSKEELDKIRNWRWGTKFDTDKWKEVNYVPMSKISLYNKTLENYYNNFWKRNIM